MSGTTFCSHRPKKTLGHLFALLLICGTAILPISIAPGPAQALEVPNQAEGAISLNPTSPAGAPSAQAAATAVAVVPGLGRIYTVNNDYTLSAIDERTGEIAATVALGSNPAAIAADETRGLLFVLVEVPSSRRLRVDIYNASDLVRVAAIPLGNGVNGRSLIFDSQRNVVYAAATRLDANGSWTRLWAVDAASRGIRGSATYQGFYRGMAHDAASGRLLLLQAHGTGSPSLTSLAAPSLAEERRVFLPVPSGGEANGLALDPAAQLAYFAVALPGGSGSGLSVLDLATGALQPVISLDLYPDGIAFDPGKGRILVVAREPAGRQHLIAIDAQNREVLRRVPLMHQSWTIFDRSIVLDPERPRLYLPSVDGVINVVDSISYDVRTILLSHRLGGLAFDDPAGRLYVASTNDDAVLVVDPARRQVVGKIEGVGSLPTEVLVDPSIGRVYVLSEYGHRLSVADSRTLAVEASREFAARIYSVALNPSTHRLYALAIGDSPGASRLLAFDGRRLDDVAQITFDVSQGPPHSTGALGIDHTTNRIYLPQYPVWLVVDGASLAVVGRIPSSGRSIAVDSRDGRAYQFHWCDAKSCGTRTLVVDLRTGAPLAQLEDVGQVFAFNSRLGHAYTANGPVGVLDANTYDWIPLGPRADHLVADESTSTLYALSQSEGLIRIYRDRIEPSHPSLAALPVTKIEIVWPHDSSGQARGVTEAPLVNVGAALFQPRSFVPFDCTAGSRLTLWAAQNGEPGSPVATGTPRFVAQPSNYFGPSREQKTPIWDFNDVDVRASQDLKNKTYFWLEVEGRDVATNVWSHAADARTFLPTQLAPSNVTATVGGSVDARIQILWPHDEAGNERPVLEANLANLGVDLLDRGSRYSVPPDWNPTVRLYRSLDNGPQPLVAIGRKELITREGITYPRWFFDDIDVSAARNPARRYYFRVAVDGVTTHSSIWAHGADARTIFPRQDVAVTACAP